MRSRVLGLVLLAACHSDSGTTVDAPPADAPALDASPFRASVHGTVVQLSSRNDGSGAPMTVSAPADTATTHLTVHRADGTSAAVALGSDGTFAFGIVAAGDAYRVTLAVDGQPPKDFASRAPALALAVAGAGRQPRSPVVNEIVVKAVFDNWNGADEAILDSTGLWTSTGQQFVDTPGSAGEPWGFEWTWSTANSLSGNVGLLDASQHDALQITEWHDVAGSAGSAYRALTAALVHADVTMTNGSNIELGADDNPIPIPALPPRCVKVVAPRAAELARVAAAVPDTYDSAVANWELQVPAGDGLGPTGALAVAIAGETGSADDASQVVSFGSPFGGTKLLASTSAHEVRAVHATAGDTPAFVQTGTQSWIEAAMPVDCSGTLAVVNPVPVVAIPSVPAIDGILLDQDHSNLELVVGPGAPLTVTWSQAGSGVADEYVAELVQVSDELGQTTLTPVGSVVTTEPTAELDGSLFQPSQRYLIEIFARQGFPGAGSGDFATIAFPFATGVTISHTFKLVESTI